MVEIGGRQEHSFAEPLGLLSDCHRRIEMFLGRLTLAAERFQGGALPPNARQAIEGSLRYFQDAAPLHTADEEASLFPVLRAIGDDGMDALLGRLSALEADHQVMTARHADVDRLVRQWLDRDALTEPKLAELQTLLQELRSMYEAHIAVEDREVFPLAASLLSPEQCRQVGQAMAARRHVPFG